jgi:hypothetical protein
MSDEMKAAINGLLKHDHVSFAELDRLPGFGGGDHVMFPKEYPNIVYWANMTLEGVQALEELEEDGAFHYHQSDQLVYLIDGAGLKFPIARDARQYKEPHWLPLVLKRGSGPCWGDKACPKARRRRAEGAQRMDRRL